MASKELPQQMDRSFVKENLIKIKKPKESYSSDIADRLEETVYGQREACEQIAKQLAIYQTGISDPNKPLGSMFFTGKSGTGKTESSRAIAGYMFQNKDSDRLKIINMAEFQEKHYITRFVGAPPTYVGYNEESIIPHDWLHKGRSIVVLDEFEKAHPQIKQLFLGVLDKGKMVARNGKHGQEDLNFTDSILIFTSNIASKKLQNISEGQQIGFQDDKRDKKKDREDAVKAGLKKSLSPELVNRLDAVITFNEIEGNDIQEKILNKFIAERNTHLLEYMGAHAPRFGITQEMKNKLIKEADNKGGRELKRLLDEYFFDKAADVLMEHDMYGKPLVGDWEKNRTVFYTDDSEPEPPMPDDTPPEEPEPNNGNISDDEAKQMMMGGVIKINKGERVPPKPPEKEKSDKEIAEKEYNKRKERGELVFFNEDTKETMDIGIVFKKNNKPVKGNVLSNIPVVTYPKND